MIIFNSSNIFQISPNFLEKLDWPWLTLPWLTWALSALLPFAGPSPPRLWSRSRQHARLAPASGLYRVSSVWNYLPIFPGCLLLIRELRHMPPHWSLPGPLSQILPASCKSLSLPGLAFLSSLYILYKVTSCLLACRLFPFQNTSSVGGGAVMLLLCLLCLQECLVHGTCLKRSTMKSCLWSVFRGWNKRPLSLCGLTMSVVLISGPPGFRQHGSPAGPH